MKKSVKVRVICLIVAAVMLSGAVTAAAILGSPYETMKRALLDALTVRNATAETYMTASVNGVPVEENRSFEIMGDNSIIIYNFSENSIPYSYHYYSNGLNINPIGFTSDDGTDWYSASVSPETANSYSRRSSLSMFSPEDRNSAQMRFYELLLDTLVGDLKNNITMTSENGIRYVSGTLTENQIPEIAKAGIDMLVEESSRYYGGMRDVSFDGREYVFENINIEHGVKTATVFRQTVQPMSPEDFEAWENGTFFDKPRGDIYWGEVFIDGTLYHATGPQEFVNEYQVPATRADYGNHDNPLENPMKSLVINYIHGEAEIDASGNLLSVDVSGTATVTNIFDEVNIFEVKATLRFSDIGTSDPVCPIPGAQQLLTSDYVNAKFGSRQMNVYFTLKEDGSIDESSITTTFPGEVNSRIYTSIDMPAPIGVVGSADGPPPPMLVTTREPEAYDSDDVFDDEYDENENADEG